LRGRPPCENPWFFSLMILLCRFFAITTKMNVTF